MRTRIFAIFAAALFLVGMSGCTVEDNPTADGLNPLEQSLVGLWWNEFEYADVTEAGVPFSRALLAVDVAADHTGCIYLGVFDGSSDEPVAVYGGPDDAGFKWQLLPDGSVELIDPATHESRVVTRADNGGNFGKDMTNVAATKVTVTDGGMTVTNGNYSGNLTKADAVKKAEIEQKLAAAPETAPQGAITGAFSVGNGKKVFFAKGNLQFVGKWQFAEHQWDIIGRDQHLSYRDLFGWGTARYPNNVSTNAADYSWAEWGTNTIANAAKGYRTLTFEECVELIRNLRKYNHSGLATVNGVRGVVMLCDRWKLPSGCTFNPIPDDTYNDWNSNTYTAEQWATMEAAGAVFLPCAGQRNGTLEALVNVYPFYWLSSKFSDNEAYALSYTNRFAMPRASFSVGLSVRLVKDAE